MPMGEGHVPEHPLEFVLSAATAALYLSIGVPSPLGEIRSLVDARVLADPEALAAGIVEAFLRAAESIAERFARLGPVYQSVIVGAVWPLTSHDRMRVANCPSGDRLLELLDAAARKTLTFGAQSGGFFMDLNADGPSMAHADRGPRVTPDDLPEITLKNWERQYAKAVMAAGSRPSKQEREAALRTAFSQLGAVPGLTKTSKAYLNAAAARLLGNDGGVQ